MVAERKVITMMLGLLVWVGLRWRWRWRGEYGDKVWNVVSRRDKRGRERRIRKIFVDYVRGKWFFCSFF